ncbi:ABC transporter permease [Mycoplasma capricolum subsp. capricolum]|uniref:ABC transporter permease n=1 Tax=Mycoplasma capricolum TaxID=2095 RepID=UPI0020C1427F|nr:ABC transporter permease [Mycoplasma capricolum]MCK8461995.1 ABC transporter permease [Mycoplasma capricolum subsp. capricolum]
MFNFQLWKNSFKNTLIVWLFCIPFFSFISIILLISIKSNSNSISITAYQTILRILFDQYGILIISTFLISGTISLMTRPIEKGHLTYILSSNLSRTNIVLSRLLYFLFSITVYVFIVFLINAVFMKINHIKTEEINLKNWALQCFSFWIMVCAIGSLCFMFSCIFNKGTWVLIFNGAIFTIFVASDVISQVGKALDRQFLIDFKNFTILSLIDFNRLSIKTVSEFYISYLILVGIIILSSSIAIISFTKKDLAL